jgi:hypothetical protein
VENLTDGKSMYKSIKVADIEAELENNKKLIDMTKGDEDGDDTAGSDSEPSEDNLEEEEMAKIIPIKAKPKKEIVKKPEPKKKPDPPVIKKLTNRNVKDEKSPTNTQSQ